jgi:hypothetical protein
MTPPNHAWSSRHLPYLAFAILLTLVLAYFGIYGAVKSMVAGQNFDSGLRLLNLVGFRQGIGPTEKKEGDGER